MTTESILKKILGGEYGGPSISVDQRGLFILYTWTDAPASMTILAKSKTLFGLILDYNRNRTVPYGSRSVPKRKSKKEK